MLKKNPVKGLYYITHVSNLPSILQNGILSHSLVIEKRIPYTPIYNKEIIQRRHNRIVPGGDNLWSYANLYFQARNPMMYRVIHDGKRSEIAVVCVSPAVVAQKGAMISTGNAASDASEILPLPQGMKRITEMWDVIDSEWWKDEDGTKRKIMAECLVPNFVPAADIQTIYVPSL